MKFNIFQHYLSSLRLNRFLKHHKGSKKRALMLYRANLRLSQAFYPLLSILEITLRNGINQCFINYFSDNDWLINQKNGFMSNPKLKSSNNHFFMKKKIIFASNKLGTTITHDSLVSELTFGYWTTFFEKNHYAVLRGQVINIFPYLPKQIKRSNIYDRLTRIRLFRNRVYHYEPICFDRNGFSLKETLRVYKEILEILGWFDKDLVEYLSPIDFVEYESQRTKNLSNDRHRFYYFEAFRLKLRFLLKKIYYFIKIEKYK